MSSAPVYESNVISLEERCKDLGVFNMPDPGQSRSSFNVDAMISLGRLEESNRVILQAQIENTTAMREIQSKLTEMARLSQLQGIHDEDIKKLKTDVAEFKEQRAWLVGAGAIIGAILAFLSNIFKGQ